MKRRTLIIVAGTHGRAEYLRRMYRRRVAHVDPDKSPWDGIAIMSVAIAGQGGLRGRGNCVIWLDCDSVERFARPDEAMALHDAILWLVLFASNVDVVRL